jgi:hypothetical protein
MNSKRSFFLESKTLKLSAAENLVFLQKAGLKRRIKV